MSEEIEAVPANGKGSFSHMKQWILAKLQLPVSTSDADGSSTESGSVLPKIVISRGSDKSLHRIATSPLIRRPSPLTKTWLTYNGEKESAVSSPTAPSLPRTPKLPNRGLGSSLKLNPVTRRPAQKSESLPQTPVDGLGDTGIMCKRTHTMDAGKISSPVFRFSAKQRLLTELEIPGLASGTLSNSELDSFSICGACGQKKYYDSQDLVGFKPEKGWPVCSSSSTLKDMPLDHRKTSIVDLRRSSSCRIPDKKQQVDIGQITRATSNVDIQGKTEGSKFKRIKRTGSKERSRSVISLTRTWSVNLDPLRFVRTTSDCKRKMSLNDNELRGVGERRRSSLLRLCIQQSCDETGTDDGTKSELSSEKGETDYSPKVTRSAIFKHASMGSRDPVENFRSTFESESIKIPSVYGQIKVTFQFFGEKNDLHVTLLKGSNLARGCLGTLGVYAKLCLMPGKVQMKVCDDKHDTQNPVFYELFVFKVNLDQLLESELRIKFYNKPGIFSRSKPIGECHIPMYYYDLTAVTVIWQNLMKSKGHKDDLDEFDFSPIEKNCVQPDGLLCGLGRRKKKSRDSSPKHVSHNSQSDF